ncbi:MAG: UDP-N-acetylglucosamine 4,6-dehydratase (inverting) [Rhodospirillales bacterium]|nr:UDP-N-acetylglucosamine 4,6-dehydratase (inverting) [Rhodospirillales bacterium]
MWLSNFYDLSINPKDKSILITGGTGSFGKRLVRTILERYDVRRLIIYSRDELKQHEMQQEFNPRDYPCLRYFIGDVRDRDRLAMATREVDIIVHAAALKHVPVAEYNPTECIRTNINGAENVVECALKNGIEKVIALSTDKAVNPINLYGASKLASDKIFVAANNLAGSTGTTFSVVRYGNVVGSRGSVVPLFERLVREGAKTIPITDPDMTRFWITLQQGVDFVISCLANMQGGEIYVPKIPSMKLTDFASALAPDTPQETVGIRPGEKLHEVMVTEDDAPNTFELPDRYVIEPSFPFWSRERSADGNKNVEAKPVPKGFRYASDNNVDWLDAEGLLSLLAEPR